MQREAGPVGRMLAHGVVDGLLPPVWERRAHEYPLTGEVLTVRDRRDRPLRVRRAPRSRARVRGACLADPASRLARARGELPADLPSDRFVVGCFGHLNPAKRLPQLLDAFALLRERVPEALLLLVGSFAPGLELELPDGAVHHDYVDEQRLWSLLAATDVCVEPPLPDDGRDLWRRGAGAEPRAAARRQRRRLVRRPAGRGGDQGPGRGRGRGARRARWSGSPRDPERRAEMGAAARALAEGEHELERVAEAYTAALEEAAGGEAVRDAVRAEIATAAAETGLRPDGDGAGRDRGAPPGGRPRPLSGLWLALRPGRSACASLSEAPRAPRLLALGALLLVSLAVRIWLTGRIATPWIMTDELIYSEMAKSFASSGHFLIRGAPSDVVSVAYPALISPAWWLHPMSTTYGVAKALNVVLMTAAAVPLFLWARRLVSPLLARCGGGADAAASLLRLHGDADDGERLPAGLRARRVRVRRWRSSGRRCCARGSRSPRSSLAFARPPPGAGARGGAADGDPAEGAVRAPGRAEAEALAVRVGRSCGATGSPARCWPSAPWCTSCEKWRADTRSRAGSASYQAVAHGGYSFGEVRHWVLLHFAELPLSAGVLPVCAFLLLLGLAFRRGGTRSEAERAFLAVTTAAVALDRGRGRGLCLALLASDRGAVHVLPRAAALPRLRALARPRAPASARAGDARGGRSGRAVVRASARQAS